MKPYLDTIRQQTRLILACRYLLYCGGVQFGWEPKADDIFNLARRLGWNDPADEWARMTPR